IWRGRHRRDFDAHDKALLDLVEPAFIAALRRARCEEAPLVLSPREVEVARCVARGFTDKQIAAELDISVNSVRTYLRRIGEKCGVTHRAGIAALRWGSLRSPPTLYLPARRPWRAEIGLSGEPVANLKA